MFVSDQIYEVEFQKNNRINITIVVKLLTPLDGLLCSRHYAEFYMESHFVLPSVFCSRYFCYCQFTF